MTNSKQFGNGFNDLADTSDLESITLVNNDQQHVLENIPGKQASVKILHAIASKNDNKITTKEAKEGLELYGDYTQEEIQNPNSHPNIRLLLNVIEKNETWYLNAK